MDKVIEVDCRGWEMPQYKKDAVDLISTRKSIVDGYMKGQKVEATVLVMAYNRLNKTKNCIDSILKNTHDVSYKLLLVDNGSDDGETFDYFKSVKHPYKTVLRLSKNYHFSYLFFYEYEHLEGRYFVSVNNDQVVTPRWLSNMIKCAKSDPRIGIVTPLSSNTSNLQCVNFHFSDYDEMQAIAEQMNKSDPKKWHERLRLITLGTLFTRECLSTIGWPIVDPAFIHDFGDDDLTFRVRRTGYKAILAKDTWIHHDHNLSAGEDKDIREFQESLTVGRENFKEKYMGIDAWDDVNNYPEEFLDYIGKPKTMRPRILGIDVKCGTPVLEIKNRLRMYNIFDAEISAFSQNEKYELDLKTICDGTVACDREEFLADYFPNAYFDYIFIDKYINAYHEPQKILRDAISMLKPDGKLYLKLKNSYNLYTFLNSLGYRSAVDAEFAYGFPVEMFLDSLTDMGASARVLAMVQYENVPDEALELGTAAIKSIKLPEKLDDVIGRLLTSYFPFEISKN